MPYAAGQYTTPTNSWSPAVTGTTINATDWEALRADLQTALSTCILKDGSQTVTASIPMNSNKFTGLAAGSATGDSLRYEQLFNASGITLLGPVAVPDGSAAAPSVRIGDEQNGFWSPAASTLGITFNGTAAARWNATGLRLGLDTAPASPLDVKSEASAGIGVAIIGRTADDIGRIRFLNSAYTTEIALIEASSTGTLKIYTGSSTTNRLVIDNNGAIQTGAATAATGYTSAGDITLPATGKIRSLNTAKAWCYFTIAGGTVTLQAGSHNVTSVTDNGVGDYTVNMTNATADALYAAQVSGPGASNGTNVAIPIETAGGTRSTSALQVGMQVTGGGAGGAVDGTRVSVSILGN